MVGSGGTRYKLVQVTGRLLALCSHTNIIREQEVIRELIVQVSPSYVQMASKEESKNCGDNVKEEIDTEEWMNLNDNYANNDNVVANFASNMDTTNVIPKSSNHSVGSVGSGNSKNSKKKVTKRRSWKKPKGKYVYSFEFF